MGENKNPLLLYDSQLSALLDMPKEKAGKLMHSIISHRKGIDMPPEDDDLKYVYKMIVEQMDEDAAKYKEKCLRNKLNASNKRGKNSDISDISDC